MPNTPKRHHYVPELILKRFTDNHGKLHCFDKKRFQRGVFSDYPSEVFLEGHLYSTRDENNVADPALEKEFAITEGIIEPIIDKIISTMRQGKALKLSELEFELWNKFYYNQWTRVPENFRETLNDDQLDQLIEDFFSKHSEDVASWSTEERDQWKNSAWLHRVKNNIRVTSLSYPSIQTQGYLKQKGIAAALIKNPEKSFIIGSKPVVKLTSQLRTNISDANVEAWFPISHDIALSPAPSTIGVVTPFWIDDRKVRKLNQHITRQSGMIASRSHLLTKSLSGL